MNRRLLLTAAEHLSLRQWKRLGAMLDNCDPTGEIGAIDAQMAETTRLAKTIQTWWPAILVALTHDVSNARTEGFNRVIKQTKRVGCGYRNMDNYQRRILSHIAVTRPQRSAA